MQKYGFFLNLILYRIGILVVLTFIQVLPTCYGNKCPSNVQREAFSCFGRYSTQLLNMQKSTETLLTGVDVELLRAFCSAYTQSMDCIQEIKNNCPSTLHTKIESTLINFDGSREELGQLCQDDALYEVYARHMTCFLLSGSHSERCFEDIMNTTVRLMKRFDDKSLPHICRDFRKVLNCIGTNIERSCGKEAASLVPILVRPMVRRSHLCEISHDDSRDFVTEFKTTTTEAQTTTREIVITDSMQHKIEIRQNRDKNDDNDAQCILWSPFLTIITSFITRMAFDL